MLHYSIDRVQRRQQVDVLRQRHRALNEGGHPGHAFGAAVNIFRAFCQRTCQSNLAVAVLLVGILRVGHGHAGAAAWRGCDALFNNRGQAPRAGFQLVKQHCPCARERFERTNTG